MERTQEKGLEFFQSPGLRHDFHHNIARMSQKQWNWSYPGQNQDVTKTLAAVAHTPQWRKTEDAPWKIKSVFRAIVGKGTMPEKTRAEPKGLYFL